MNSPFLPESQWLQGVTNHVSSLVQSGHFREAEGTILGLQRALKRAQKSLLNQAASGDPDGSIAKWQAIVSAEQQVLSGHLSVVRLKLPKARPSTDD